MKRLVIALSLTVAFLVGCLTATVATKFVVPPIKAGTNPQKWEYHCFNYAIKEAEIDVVNSRANRLGAQGWELVAAAGSGAMGSYSGWSVGNWCFKRPLR